MPLNTWRPSTAYARISEANREYYARTASQYDATETCVVDARFQAGLRNDLNHVLEVLGKTPQTVKALDACGGSGNVALKLMEHGVDVLLVDISPDLLSIFRTRCHQLGWQPKFVRSEVADYLAGTSGEFDLITFSSALHHLQSYEDVLRLAIGRLAPGGLLFTTFDPTLRSDLSKKTRILLALDYYAFKLFRQTADLPSAVLRRARRIGMGVSAAHKDTIAIDDASAGVLAEYHVEQGINDRALVRFLEAQGTEVLWHRRRTDARFDCVRRLLSRWDAATTFTLLVRRKLS